MVTYVYTGAVPKWINHRGERVFKVYGEYWRDGQLMDGGCFEFMTATGSQDVHA